MFNTNEILQNINWHSDDGVNFPMINGYARNNFYDKMLEGSAANKTCLDIGFGTGLLSIIALKHGAKNIIAYESDYARYVLGKEIILRLGLEDKIELLNEKYSIGCAGKHNAELIFCEIVNQNLWGEGLMNVIGLSQTALILPSNYLFEVRAFEVSNNFIERILNPNIDVKFNPSIDLDKKFIDTVNELISERYGKFQPNQNQVENGLIRFDQFNRRYWELQVINKSSVVEPIVGYEFDVNTMTVKIKNQHSSTVVQHDKTIEEQTYVVDTEQWCDRSVILIPRVAMKYNNQVLYLEDAEGWGPARDPVILVNPRQNLKISHNFYNGNIKMDMI